MRVLCSPKGLMDFMSPKQGVTDILRSGMDASVIDFSLFCDPFIMERYGWDLDRMQKRIEMLEKMIAICKEKGLSLPLAQTTYLRPDTKRQRGFNFLRGLAEQAVRISGEAGAEAIIVYPLTAGVSRDELWRTNRDYYLTLGRQARERGMMTLLTNVSRDVGGHNVRGAMSDPREAAEWIDALNEKLGEECFGFCLRMEAVNESGQDIQSMIAALGQRLKAVEVSDYGAAGAVTLPFLGSGRNGLRADWLGLLRGLREIDFDGYLIVNLRDTASVISPLLRPSFMPFVKKVADYLIWQINLEKPLKQYKSIVLFGAGNMCQNYMLCYGKEHPPLFTCDNNKKRWGERFCGLDVCPPDKLRELSPDTVILICNIYYREIDEQLRGMGLKNPIAYFNDEYLPRFAQRIEWDERS